MGDYIIDGTGSGYSAKVTADNELLVAGSFNATVTSEPTPYDTSQQYVAIAGSPTAGTILFVSGVSKTLMVKASQNTHIEFNNTATSESFLLNAGESISADFSVGSVSHLYNGTVGSVWVWTGW